MSACSYITTDLNAPAGRPVVVRAQGMAFDLDPRGS
jgi:hypothetical protein